MSVNVKYAGKLVPVTCAPMTGMQEVLAKAAEAHGLAQPERYALWHKQSEVDVSQPFRFTGLANKVTLDLKTRSVKQKAAAAAPVTLAISVQGAGSVVDSFPPEMTLSGVLATFVCNEKLSEDILSANPSMQHFGQSFTAEALETTTLMSLGLSGQQVRMQLRHTIIPDDTGASGGSGGPSTKKEFKPVTNFFKSMFGGKKKDTDAGATGSSGGGSSSTGPPSPSSSSSSSTLARGSGSDWSSVTMKRPFQQQSVFQSGGGNKLGDGPGATATPVCAASPPSSPVKPAASAPAQAPAPEPMEVSAPPTNMRRIGPFVTDQREAQRAFEVVAHSNGASSAAGAVGIMVKYIENVVKNPLQEKFRSIKTTNKVYQERVGCVTGAMEFLESLGFERTVQGDVEMLVVAAPDMEFLEKAVSMLKSALVSLAPLPSSSSSSPRGAPSSSSSTFDPYKSHVTRNAKQPERSESSTERQLEALQARRAAIQGDMNSVERCTRVISIGAPSASSLPDVTAGAGETDERAERKLQAQSAAAAIKDFGKAQDKPLTTKAVRDLERAKKEKVFAKTLLKVRFPDGMQLQGYFHPHDNVVSVFDWIATCLCDSWTFEVFTSPPKNVLLTNVPTKAGRPSPFDTTSTLEQLSLVPAAIIYVDWLGAERPVPDVPGCYLLEQLLLGPLDTDTASGPMYPEARTLVPQERAEAKAFGSSSGSSDKDGKDGDGGSSKKASGGPKWMKL